MLEHLKAMMPDAETVLAFEPEELGAKLIFLLRQYGGNMFNLANIEGELHNSIGPVPLYPRPDCAPLGQALREAFAWLEAQGLIVPAADMNGRNGWRVLSRRAYKFQNEKEFASYTAARRLRKDSLHPRIRDGIWSAFMRNEFDVAAFLAMKAVEVAVREAAGLESGDIGVKLMRQAFNNEKGPLTDLSAEGSERQAMGDLFAGAIGVFKNPHSHRDVDLTDPAEAAEIVMMANLLLRIVEERSRGNAD